MPPFSMHVTYVVNIRLSPRFVKGDFGKNLIRIKEDEFRFRPASSRHTLLFVHTLGAGRIPQPLGHIYIKSQKGG